MFRLKRPCHNCPFRTDIPGYLRPARTVEISTSLVKHGDIFHCHATNQFDAETGDAIVDQESQHCAGAILFLMHLKRPNSAMQIGDRLRQLGRGGSAFHFDPEAMDMEAPVCTTVDAFITRHRAGLQKEEH